MHHSTKVQLILIEQRIMKVLTPAIATAILLTLICFSSVAAQSVDRDSIERIASIIDRSGDLREVREGDAIHVHDSVTGSPLYHVQLEGTSFVVTATGPIVTGGAKGGDHVDMSYLDG